MQNQKSLEQLATAMLRRAGYTWDGRKKSEKRASIRAISTPCGGQKLRRPK